MSVPQSNIKMFLAAGFAKECSYSFHNLNMKLRVGVPPRSAGGGDRAAPGENICAVSTLGGDAGRVLGLPDSN